MKITVKDEAELRETVKSKFAKLRAKSDAETAFAAVKEWLDENEISDEAGHILKMDLKLEEVEPAAPAGDASNKALDHAIKAIDKIVEKIGKIPAAPKVEITDDSERLMQTKNWGYKHLGEFALDVYRAQNPNANMRATDKRLELIAKAFEARNKAAPATYASELVGADGGWMVPPENREEVWVAVRDNESILGMCDLTPTTSNVVTLPADENTPWDNSNGIKTYWLAQGAAITPTKPIIQTRQVQLHTINALVPATEELLNDAPRLNSYLMEKAPAKIGWQIDDAIFNGTGAGQPLGITKCNSRIVVARNATTSDYSGTDVSNMIARLLEPSSNATSASFFMTKRLWAKTALLTYGTSLGYPVALEGENLKNAIIPTLLGYPVRKSMHTAALASAGDMILGDLKNGYAAFYRADDSVSSFAASMHLYFDAGAVAFRWRFRVGGEPYLRGVVTPPYDTTATLSHFVILGSTSQESFN